MKKSTRFLGIALVGVARPAAPAERRRGLRRPDSASVRTTACSRARTNGPSLRSSFWILDNGNPAVGPGIDNGERWPSPDDWVDSVQRPAFAVSAELGRSTAMTAAPITAVPPCRSGAWPSRCPTWTARGNMIYAVMCSPRDRPSRGREFRYDFPSGCGDGALCTDRAASRPEGDDLGHDAFGRTGAPSRWPLRTSPPGYLQRRHAGLRAWTT